MFFTIHGGSCISGFPGQTRGRQVSTPPRLPVGFMPLVCTLFVCCGRSSYRRLWIMHVPGDSWCLLRHLYTNFVWQRQWCYRHHVTRTITIKTINTQMQSEPYTALFNSKMLLVISVKVLRHRHHRKLPANCNFITRCHAIAGSTARCGCKFRYVSKFSVAWRCFHCNSNACRRGILRTQNLKIRSAHRNHGASGPQPTLPQATALSIG